MSNQPTYGSDKGSARTPPADIETPITSFIQLDVNPLSQLSQIKKNMLVLIFSVASFLDICNVTGVGLAVSNLSVDLGLEVNQIAWIITSYSLTFAAVLLFAGRLSDIFSPSIIFDVGFVGLGAISLATSFVTTNKFGFLILRGVGGILGALTIPSAFAMVVRMFPDPVEQQSKLTLLGMAGAIGNVLGMVLAGVAMLASYHWFFRIISILCFVFAAMGLLLLPRTPPPASNDRTPKWKKLDVLGVILMMGFLVCLLISLTQGPIDGWNSLAFIIPIVVSFVCLGLFFLWEYKLPSTTAILPASVYQIKNFVPASIMILVPLAFFMTSQLYYATYFQVAFGWSPLKVAAAIIPQGVMGLVVGVGSQFFPSLISKPRIFIPIGVIMILGSEILMIYSYGGAGYDYWKFVFPAYVIGATGAMIVYFASAVNIIIYAPPEMAGVISSWTQVLAQVGGAIALGVMAAFETEDLTKWMESAGRTFWFVFGWSAAIGLQYVIFWRQPGTPAEEHELVRRRIEAKGRGEGVIRAGV